MRSPHSDHLIHVNELALRVNEANSAQNQDGVNQVNTPVVGVYSPNTNTLLTELHASTMFTVTILEQIC